ncbi:hypothetical protein COEREDRAFT_84677 [Coemansia reversa NRRL 1564]|uniref:F-box domain-containing protein n=1 Tax=Coemansia reversa (strain ATCC 12441 / NRRL 1564) TaxID=763665 RepID=A0A2G5BK50_COERN|nr:hypothetical protein COEREDRAFT_84677 [Coemansia reversa NRRL 1564]|eukprot:PIA19383.1 hypothetical protein COEREDRAFT_84677 [Coemansia reversa NRRL 1564]
MTITVTDLFDAFSFNSNFDCMATISKLSDDIILRIVHLLTLDAGKCLRSWKTALPILAVCRQWRICASHAVYCTAIVGDGPSIEIGYQNNKFEKKDDIYKKNQKTNTTLIQSNGFQHYVSTIIISQTPEQCVYRSLDAIMDALVCTETCGWINARTLSVTFCQTLQNIELFCRDSGKNGFTAEKQAHLVIKQLPNIQKLVARTMMCDVILNTFLRTLCRSYFIGLKQLWWLVPTLIGGDYYHKSQVTDYYLCQANNQCQLPVINPEPLQMLHMRPFRATFSWSCFINNRGIDSNIIEFKNLRSLVLDGYHHGIHVLDSSAFPLYNDMRPKLVFPVLERLVINGTSLQSEMYKLFAASPLKTIVFCGALADLNLLHMLKLNRLDLLHIDVHFGYPDTDEDIYRETNSIIQSATNIGTVMLSIDVEEVLLIPTKISWQNLTHLCLYDTMVTDFGLNLISVLPCLMYLKVCSYKVGDNWTANDISVYFDDLRQKYPGPLLTSNVNTVVLILARTRAKLLDSMLIQLFQNYLPTLDSIEVS